MIDDVCRLPDGSIDFDFYRTQAPAGRRQARPDTLCTVLPCGSVMAGAFGFALVIPWSSAHLPTYGR